VKNVIRDLLKRIPYSKELYHRFRSKSISERIDIRDEALMLRILDRVLLPDSTCIDVGAHKGQMMNEIVCRSPRGRHFAFEAIPALCSGLHDLWPQFTVQNVAVGERSAEIEFHWVATNPAFSGIERRTDLRAEDVVEKIRVRQEPLDVLVLADVVVRLIKIDVEGAEMGVLRGAERILTRDRPYVLFEHGSASALYGTTSDALFDECHSRDLSIWRMDRWLDGLPPYSVAEFSADVDSGGYWNFLAAPSESKS